MFVYFVNKSSAIYSIYLEKLGLFYLYESYCLARWSKTTPNRTNYELDKLIVSQTQSPRFCLDISDKENNCNYDTDACYLSNTETNTMIMLFRAQNE